MAKLLTFLLPFCFASMFQQWNQSHCAVSPWEVEPACAELQLGACVPSPPSFKPPASSQAASAVQQINNVLSGLYELVVSACARLSSA